MATPSELKPVFIFGCYRSGTSLLRLILNAHPEITIPEETLYVPILGRQLQKYGDLSIASNQDRLVRDALEILARKARWATVPSVETVTSFLHAGATYPDIIQAIALLSTNRTKGIRYWGDKTPWYVESGLYLSTLFPNAKFIHVVRDGRDVLASVRKDKINWPLTAMQVAEEWSFRITNALALKAVLPSDRVIELRYEDLVTWPNKTVADVTQFLQLPFNPSMLQYYKTDRAHLLSRYKWHQNVTKPIFSSSVGQYEHLLSAEERLQFERRAGQVLAMMGYIVSLEKITAPTRREVFLDLIQRVGLGVRFGLANVLKRNTILNNVNSMGT